MHRKNPISVLVYNTLFPTPSPTDPPSFSAHLSKNLVGEVRIETANFYGSLDTIEARYPGLNYAFAPHRKRLGRFPHHRRLFDAFDRLALTESEIQGFCRWEGTLWARERYERDEGVRVEDTTGVEIKEWVDRRARRRSSTHNRYHNNNNPPKGINVKTDIEVEIEQVAMSTATASAATPSIIPTTTTATTTLDTDMPDSDSDSEESDAEMSLLHTSIGYSLNARLLHAAALRDQGANVSMDPEWEQYLKEAHERGELHMDTAHQALRTMAQLHQAQHFGGAGERLGPESVAAAAAAATVDSTSPSSRALAPPAAPA